MSRLKAVRREKEREKERKRGDEKCKGKNKGEECSKKERKQNEIAGMKIEVNRWKIVKGIQRCHI